MDRLATSVPRVPDCRKLIDDLRSCESTELQTRRCKVFFGGLRRLDRFFQSRIAVRRRADLDEEIPCC